MKNYNFKILFIIVLIFGCAKVETINLKTHHFNKSPDNIIWFQIAGLDEEHLAMLRFNLKDDLEKTSFENSTCIGKTWSYNLYSLRPGPRNSFQSQLASHKNIKGSCKDFSERPFWKKIDDERYQVGIFESGASKKQSFVQYSTCEENNFSKDFIVWSMSPPPKKSERLLFSSREYQRGNTYFDSSCKNKSICYSSIQNNIQNIWMKFSKTKGRKIFIIRDYSYYNFLMKRDILSARETLAKLEKIHKDFKNTFKNSLILVSSGAPRKFEFPSQGRDWANFEKTGKKVLYRRDSLLSPVFADGNTAENFCGIYNESELGQRVFWSPRVEKLKIFR